MFIRPLFRTLLLTGFLALSGSQPALAADRDSVISKAESYLNSITTLRAHFTQVAPSGEVSEGAVAIFRPGRMRLDYNPPSQVQIVANGDHLIYFDRQLGQPSYLDLEASPAGVLVRPHIRLNAGDIRVTAVAEHDGLTEVTVHHPENPADGKITLIFTTSPWQLRQWRVLDTQGQLTVVSLYNVQTGMALDSSLFRFEDPNFTTPMDQILGRKPGR